MVWKFDNIFKKTNFESFDIIYFISLIELQSWKSYYIEYTHISIFNFTYELHNFGTVNNFEI